MTRILIVDDSALMRKSIRQVLESEAGFEVHTARDGQDALDQIPDFDPDVITLDINMPVMDGLTCLSHIMTRFPRPVVMVSSLTEKGALATFEAMEMGAVDFVCKPGGTVSLNIKEIFPELVGKVREAAQSRRQRAKGLSQRLRSERRPTRQTRSKSRPRPRARSFNPADGLVLIGVSTGGPRTLDSILPHLPPDFPLPVLVAQHMPATFTNVFARRLDQRCALNVTEVNRLTPLESGQILIAQGDADVVISRRGNRLMAASAPPHPDLLWHPSVERMVRSALEHYSAEALIAVELTGMGDDGADAMAELHRRGGRTVAEAEETAIVFGMPRALIEKQGADRVLPCHRIAGQLVRWAMSPVGVQATA